MNKKLYAVTGDFGGTMNVLATSFSEAEAKFRADQSDARRKTMNIRSIQIIADNVQQ